MNMYQTMHVVLYSEKNMEELITTNFSTRGVDNNRVKKVSSYDKEPGKD